MDNCISCGVPFTDHMGLIGTCAEVQRLKAEVERLKENIQHEIEVDQYRVEAELEAQRYRQALEFYAEEGNWYIRFGGDMAFTSTGTSACDADGGKIAREALEVK